MSEEEKKAIKYFKNKIGDFELLYGKKITTQENEHLKILLSLIEKQQKEIKKLKNITNSYNSFEGNLMNDTRIIIADSRYFLDGTFVSNFISKDKIREIIERLRKQHKNIFDSQMLYKELLEGGIKWN